jgi:Uma2 family endonuclease
MLTPTVQGGASLTLPMSFEEYEALGETKHTAYYDQLAHVNPPTRRHVQIARRLTRILEDAAPAEYEVLPEAGWAVGPQQILVPDIMVARRNAPGPDLLREPPLLVIEVLSRSTRSEDVGRKRELYAKGGANWYWLVDPDAEDIHMLGSSRGTLVEHEVAYTGVAQLHEPFLVALDLGRIFA